MRFAIIIEYSLTEKGKSLNRILHELAMFSINECPEEVLKKSSKAREESIKLLNRVFGSL